MRADGVTSGTPISFWAHGGTREPVEAIAPSYEAGRHTQDVSAANHAEHAAWVPHERFAPAGPAYASLPTVHLVVPLFGEPVYAAVVELPEALLDEPAVLERIAALVAQQEPASASSAELVHPADQDDDTADQYDALPLEPEAAPPPEALLPPYGEPGTDPAAPPPEPEAKSRLLSWLDRSVRAQHDQPDSPPDEPQPQTFGEGGLLPPHVEPAEAAVASQEAEDEPQRLAPQPRLQPVDLAAPAVAGAPRLRHFGLRLPGRASSPPPSPPEPAPPTQIPPLPDEMPVVAEAGPVPPPPPAPARIRPAPSPPIDVPPGSFVVPETGGAPVLRNFGQRLPLRAPSSPSASPRISPPVTEIAPPAAADPVMADAPQVPPPPKPEPAPPAVVAAPRSKWFGLRLPRREPVSPAPPPLEGPSVQAMAGARRVRRFEPRLPSPAPVPPIEPVMAVEAPPAPASDPVPPAALRDRNLPRPSPGIVQEDPAARAPADAADPKELQSRPAAYWAEPKWAKSSNTAPDQPDSLAWTPPPSPPSGMPAGRRTTPAMAGLWAAEPTDAADTGSEPRAGTGQRVIRRAAAIVAGLIILAGAGLAVFLFLPSAFVSNMPPEATFNAPMMVLRATGPGRVASIAVQNGQTVEPNTLLLTIRTEPQPDPAATLLRDRLEAAQAHLAQLDQALAQATPTSEAARARIADLRRQRAAAATDVAQLQDGVTNIPPVRPADLPVQAGVHGVIRSLEARAGEATAAGVPLVRMLDCDHAFLTVGPDTKLRAGEAVQVRLPNLPPVAAVVRRSAGIAEPPDALVIATAPGAFVGELSGSCPVGATATVTPSLTGRASS